MSSESRTEEVKAEIATSTSKSKSPNELMSRIVKLLHDRMLKFNWVGFYMLEDGSSSKSPSLRGAAASTGKTVVVDDVSQDSRYLACSIETKSEIVVPIFVGGKVRGELDIDSHFFAAFGKEERELVEYCANLVGQCLEKTVS